MTFLLDQELRSIALTFAQQFQKEYGCITSGDELRDFIASCDLAITEQVSAVSQRLLFAATIEGVTNINPLVEAVQNAKASTVSYLRKHVAALPSPAPAST